MNQEDVSMDKITIICKRVFIACLLIAGVASCTDDELVKSDGEVVEGVPVTMSLNLSFVPAADVVVTKADNNDYSVLRNLVLFIYSGDGTFQKVVQTFDRSLVLGSTGEEITGGVRYSMTFEATSGTKKLLAVGNTSITAGAEAIWGNISSLVNNAEEYSFDEMKAQVISLSAAYGEGMQPIQITSESQMLMSGWNEGVVFNANGGVTSYGACDIAASQVVIRLNRSLAHITFNIPVSVDGAKGTFVPTSYRVYNVPTNSYLTNKEKDVALTEGDNPFTFVNSASAVIGIASGGNYTFDFYMPENINEVKEITDYSDRDKWSGESGASPENKTWSKAPQKSTFVVISGTYEGTGAVEGDDTEHQFSGNVEYTVHLGDFSETGSQGNFSVIRNWSYTYNLTVKGVDNIVVEATATEDGGGFQDGAEGDIYDYTDTQYAYQLDAHYEQLYLQYNLSSIANSVRATLGSNPTDQEIDDAIADRLILVIQSEAMDYTHASTDNEPYSVQNKRGTLRPYKIYRDAVRNGNEAAATGAKTQYFVGNKDGQSGFDYKWVEFWPQYNGSANSTYNNNPRLADYPGVSSWSRATGISDDVYGGEPTEESGHLMDVYDMIVAMGKAVRMIYDGNTNGLGASTDWNVDYNDDGIIITRTGYNNYTYYACFTAFVNEYYYYNHPLTDEDITTWNVFTNKIPREMIVAMSSDVSTDGNSTYNRLYSYISQVSMQTFYNSRGISLNAFGIETYNETPLTKNFTWGTPISTNNLSKTDGRSNQLTLIGGTGNNRYNEWSFYIDQAYNGWIEPIPSGRRKLDEDAYPYESVRGGYPWGGGGTTYYSRGAYSACMSRNRDLDGDGEIDDNEVRWFLPSVNEYIRMGIGNSAISQDAKLYNGDKNAMDKGSNGSPYPTEYIDNGALYYTSSSDNERVYWAIEQGSYGNDNNVWTGWTSTAKPIRCIRVLPAELTALSGVQSDPTYEWNEGTRVLKFKDRLDASLYRRGRTDGRLSRHNEDGAANSFYEGIFVATEDVKDPDSGTDRFPLGQIIRSTEYSFRGTSDPCANYHEDGDDGAAWRTPNLAEFSAMNAVGGIIGDNYACSTQFTKQEVRYGFITAWYNDAFYIMCTGGGSEETLNTEYKVRCVRDVPAGYSFSEFQ